MRHKWTTEHADWIRQNIRKYSSYDEAARAFNEYFKTEISNTALSDYCTKRIHFPIGHNAGRFQSGGAPRSLPIGSIRKSQVGTYIKVSEAKSDINGYQKPNWIPYQQYVWEQANGPIPDGTYVMFLDGDAENFCLSNLAVIDRQISQRMAKRRWYTDNANVTKTAIDVCKLEDVIYKNKIW